MEEESLNLFNKIEAEKNQRLNIDENSELQEEKEKLDDQNLKKTEQVQREVSADSTNKQQDVKEPVDLRKASESEIKETKSTHSAQRTNNEIILKLVGISPDCTIIKINIIFNNPSKPLEITFDFDLRSDTSEGVVCELEQALPVSKSERNQIKNDIDKIVFKAIEKIQMTSESTNGSIPAVESKTPKSEPDVSYPKPQPEEQNDSSSVEYAKNLEKAQYLIHHFIGTIDQEIKTIQRNQSVLEEINPSVEGEATNLSLQFINSIIDSYNAFQYQMSK